MVSMFHSNCGGCDGRGDSNDTDDSDGGDDHGGRNEYKQKK
jgi:hypothetical protein